MRDIIYKMQRPAIAPDVNSTACIYEVTIVDHRSRQLVYPHDWREKDLVLFHNRGVLHSVVGSFTKDQVRAFHQCNLAASDVPIGPSEKDVKQWA